MQSKKAYVLRIEHQQSRHYATICVDSLERVGMMNWEYFEGFSNMKGVDAWAIACNRYNINMTKSEGRLIHLPNITEPREIIPSEDLHPAEKAECCTVGHAAIWKKIAEGEEDVGIVLEHDAYMYHNLDTLEIPENRIVVLGYKITNPQRYDYVNAGPPTRTIDIRGHEGAHAYAMTKTTAQKLINEIETVGRLGCVDNAYFILNQRRTSVPLAIADPTPAIGWLRESTIWSSSAFRNYQFIPSFAENYK